MLNSPNIPMYAHKATLINYMYAARHGYNFIVERCPRPEDLSTPWMWDHKNEYLFVWSKPTLIRKHLPFYDYILFIDSDAIVVDPAKTVEQFIAQHMTTESIIAAQDCKKTGDCWDPLNLNTGVMLVKKSPATLQLLDDWFAATNNLCKHTLYDHPREQQCLNLLRKSEKYRGQIKILPITQMGGYDGTWIQHYAAMPKANREVIITNFLNKEIKSFMQPETQAQAPIFEGFQGGDSCIANAIFETNPVELFIIAGVFIILCFVFAAVLYPQRSA